MLRRQILITYIPEEQAPMSTGTVKLHRVLRAPPERPETFPSGSRGMSDGDG